MVCVAGHAILVDMLSRLRCPADSAAMPYQKSGTRPSVAGKRAEGRGRGGWSLFWVDIASYTATTMRDDTYPVIKQLGSSSSIPT